MISPFSLNLISVLEYSALLEPGVRCVRAGIISAIIEHCTAEIVYGGRVLCVAAVPLSCGFF